MRKVKLSTCGNYVLSSKISTNNLTPENYITTDNMLPDKAGIIYSENIPKNTRVTQFLKDDILLSNIRPYFKKIWLAEYTGGCSADVLVFRTNDKYDPKYIKYCLSQDAFFAYDMAGSKGSKMPRGDKNHILNFELLDYDIATQKNIGNLLLSIDNKIKINNKINTELEKFAKILYEYWFIQFDFPDEFGRPYKSSGGAMVYNKELKREIPIGWKVKSLYEIAYYTNGLACQNYRPVDENFYNVIKIKEMHEGFSTDTEQTRIDIPEKYIVENGDILFSWSATLEIQQWVGGKGVLNQHIFKVTSEKYPKSFYYFKIKDYIRIFKRIAETRKTTMGHITIEHLKQAKVVVPPIDLVIKLDKKIRFIFNLIQNNREECQNLTKLREFLLPMLMNGQVSIIAE